VRIELSMWTDRHTPTDRHKDFKNAPEKGSCRVGHHLHWPTWPKLYIFCYISPTSPYPNLPHLTPLNFTVSCLLYCEMASSISAWLTSLADLPVTARSDYWTLWTDWPTWRQWKRISSLTPYTPLGRGPVAV